MKYHKILY